LLGLALGVSIADATEGGAIGEGLGIGALIWMLISSLIAYFLGSLRAARLAGKTDRTVGMLHGLTLWGVATTLLVVFSSMGVMSLLQTGADGVKAQEVRAAIEAIDTQTMTAIATHVTQGELRSAREALAEGTNLLSEEVREIIDSLSSEFEEQIGTESTRTIEVERRRKLGGTTKL